jgi:hypothetical protein
VITFVIVNVLVTSASSLPLRYCSTPFVLLFDKLYANMMMLTLNHRMTAFHSRIIHPQSSEMPIGPSFLSGAAGPAEQTHQTKSDAESHVSYWDPVPNNFMFEVRFLFRDYPLPPCLFTIVACNTQYGLIPPTNSALCIRRTLSLIARFMWKCYVYVSCLTGNVVISCIPSLLVATLSYERRSL